MPEPLMKRLKTARMCLNFNLKRTSRLVNQYYDRVLRPTGLRAGQFNLMVPMALRGALSVTELAESLGMERSALARNLKPLEREGWIAISVGTDRRARIVALTPKGERLLQKAYPYWEKAQSHLAAVLSHKDLNGLLKGLRAASDAARAVG